MLSDEIEFSTFPISSNSPTTTIDIKVSEMGHFKFNSTTSILELKFL